MISSYTAIVLLTSFAVIGMILGMVGDNDTTLTASQQRGFRNLYILLVLMNLSEWGAEILDGYIDLIPLRIALKFFELSITPFMLYTAIGIFKEKRLKKPAMLLCMANLAIQVTSLFTGIIFRIDANGVYSRGFLYPVYMGAVVVLLLLFIASAWKYSKQFQVQNNPIIISILIICVLATVLQTKEANLHLDWTFISVAAIMLYVYFIQLMLQNDPVTQLLNRRAFDRHIQSMSEGNVIIFFDIDHFKEQNDQFGHESGDLCLQMSAKQIRKIFGRVGRCYRYGGDEFCVIMTKDTGNREQYFENFISATKDMTYGKEYPLPTISFGSAVYDGSITRDEAVRKADEEMYRYKSRHHELNSY